MENQSRHPVKDLEGLMFSQSVKEQIESEYGVLIDLPEVDDSSQSMLIIEHYESEVSDLPYNPDQCEPM